MVQELQQGGRVCQTVVGPTQETLVAAYRVWTYSWSIYRTKLLWPDFLMFAGAIYYA